ncbi:tellurite resistance TerB family protein [Streptomyces sp. NPDC057245]|uniref:tellurite resistance TerB family protein n=1 Tax=Streptomyces TaxID=1883 RepID=UPI001C1E02F3|nr:tellurite resistance TerB family protein [Streptomyces sp. A108]MBU6532046.1 TerB family tellurite resistance protein [Streptomyces sp. A108]
MAMWDKIKDQAKTFQQSQGTRGAGGSGPGAQGSGRPGSSGGSRTQLLGMFKSQLASAKNELKSGAYRDASMAMCALVAAADGHVDPAERTRVEELIVSNEVLQNFPADQLRQRFNQHVDRLLADFAQGRSEALQVIAKASKKPEEARAVVQTGMVVAGADGAFEPSEQQAIREACSALGVPPSEFGV